MSACTCFSITNATGSGNPERREEIVTLPVKIDFQAMSCYAWFDTLPNGASGNEGDVWDTGLLKDGHKASACLKARSKSKTAKRRESSNT